MSNAGQKGDSKDKEKEQQKRKESSKGLKKTSQLTTLHEFFQVFQEIDELNVQVAFREDWPNGPILFLQEIYSELRVRGGFPLTLIFQYADCQTGGESMELHAEEEKAEILAQTLPTMTTLRYCSQLKILVRTAGFSYEQILEKIN